MRKMVTNAFKRKIIADSGSGGKKFSNHWSQGLKASMEDPNLRVFSDDMVVIIKDKYPKARHHFLVMPKESIPNLKSIGKDKIPLLKHMYAKGRDIASNHVHMHVISQDFDSDCLKTKKHWNSFTTEYFIDSEDLIKMVEEDGKVSVDTSRHQELLKKPLECHRCDKQFKNMPALKQHLLRHIPKDAT